jgi:hypothetical protein
MAIPVIQFAAGRPALSDFIGRSRPSRSWHGAAIEVGDVDYSTGFLANGIFARRSEHESRP